MMRKIRIKNRNLIIDPEKTEEILKSLKSDTETCSCLYCKNYIATGLKAYDKDFLSVMKELGIDHKKDIHTSHIVELETGEIISKTPVNEMIDTNSFSTATDKRVSIKNFCLAGSGEEKWRCNIELKIK